MGSTRLPGKVLREALGKPMLRYQLETLLRADLGPVVVATSDLPADDGIEALCAKVGTPCLRGDEADVASRFSAAIERFGFRAFVRVCGDSPLMDAELIRRALREFASGPCDLATNTFPRSFPKGQSVEVLGSPAFNAARSRFDAGDREHVTRYFYRHPGEFLIRNFSAGRDCGAIQLSVDTPEDFERFEALVAGADRPHWQYGWSDWVSAAEALAKSRAGDRGRA
ncbi:MAG: hypothetical protein JWP91_1955 [Fibrobacteres bacterium]|nr:hypothetical protein [Fibrobacterota bacterium]